MPRDAGAEEIERVSSQRCPSGRSAATTDYSVDLFFRHLPDVLAWAITLRDALPVIPIPLKGDVPDASLDLQALLHEVYDAAGYEDYLYSTPPEPPLSAEHAEWAQQFVPFTVDAPNE